MIKLNLYYHQSFEKYAILLTFFLTITLLDCSGFHGSVLMLIGYVLTGFASPALSYLLYPGSICYTVAGVSLLLSSMQVRKQTQIHELTK